MFKCSSLLLVGLTIQRGRDVIKNSYFWIQIALESHLCIKVKFIILKKTCKYDSVKLT